MGSPEWLRPASTSAIEPVVMGGPPGTGCSAATWFNGTVDEVRFAKIARTPEWLATEYANQSSPTTFVHVVGD